MSESEETIVSDTAHNRAASATLDPNLDGQDSLQSE